MSVPQALLAERYRLIRVIAAGGMGVVWEAWDERLERAVAIKQLRTQPGVPDAEAELAKDRLMREARITARLRHPYAVPVYDTVEHEGQPCLIMPFLPSVPLSTVLRERGPLPVPEAVRIGAQIASALAAAHSLDIVHRDVKPGNILITADGVAHISDFGISHAMGDATLTRTGMVYGTPAYLSPEMALGGEATFASDVFSLGATLYAAVEGAPPFGSDPNSIAMLHKVAAARVPTPQRAGVLTPFLLDMLSREPADRPAMGVVASFLADLKTDTAPVEPDVPAIPPYVSTAIPAAGPAGGVDETTRPWEPEDETDGAPAAAGVAGERTSSLPWRSALRYGATPAAVAQAPAAQASAPAATPPASAPAAAPPAPAEWDYDPEPEPLEEDDWDYEPEPEETPHPLGLGSTSDSETDSETPPRDRASNRRGIVLAVAAAIATLFMLVAATLSGQFDDDSPGTAGGTGAAPTPSSSAATSEPAASSSPIVSPEPVAPVVNPEPEPTRASESQPDEEPASEGDQEQDGNAAEAEAAREAAQQKAEEEAAKEAAKVEEAAKKAEEEAAKKAADEAKKAEEEAARKAEDEAEREEAEDPDEEAQPEDEPAEPQVQQASEDRASQLASAISSYYALMPGDTDAAWPRMTANYQTNHTGGRTAYENFWDDIIDVSISNVEGSPPDGAEATLTYYFDDGRIVVERTSYRLVEEGGTWKIAASTVLSSVSG